MQDREYGLSDQTLLWVVEVVHPDATIMSVKRLYGGISSLVYEIVLLVSEEKRSVVLRQLTDKDWISREPDLAIREAESLRLASGCAEVPTPQLIAYDTNGSRCGVPSLLMSKLEGNVVLSPPDRTEWLDRLAEALAKLHNIETADFPWRFRAYTDPAGLDTSSWSEFPDKWKQITEIVSGSPPVGKVQFIHRDYHPTNVLWAEGRVSGVVDWVNGCIGPAGIDVGHCRVNLALLYGVEAADRFLASYMNYAGEAFTYHPYWDMIPLLDFADGTPMVYEGWTALGVTGSTDRMMAERLDCYMVSLLERAMNIPL